MSSDRDKLIAEATEAAGDVYLVSSWGMADNLNRIILALVAELVRDTPEDPEWEYGIEGRFIHGGEHWSAWAVSSYDEARKQVESQMAYEPDDETAVNWLPVRRRPSIPASDWEPFTPTSEEEA